MSVKRYLPEYDDICEIAFMNSYPDGDYVRFDDYEQSVKALSGLLKFHPESPETGAELSRECWKTEYRDAVDAALAVVKPVDQPSQSVQTEKQ